jgi:large subunit ribosomal protein L25
VTGKWHDPVFSLRRQADLVKLARQHGVESLLPMSVKSTEYRLQRRMENGLRVKGTGVGQRVKGKESERTMKGRYAFERTLQTCAMLIR